MSQAETKERKTLEEIRGPGSPGDTAYRLSSRLLVLTVWISSILFGLFITSFYFVALLKGNTAQWNKILPELYDPNARPATLGMAVHFVGGAILLVLGFVQLIERLRVNYPAVHRALGRIYVLAALVASVGGLAFILLKGTIGGIVMDIAFAGYGIAMFIAAIQTARHAMARRLDVHRAWAIRLFSLAIGSWLYRMGYGLWIGLFGPVGHTEDFRGPLDYFMDFAFYIPGLFIAELYIRRERVLSTRSGPWAAAVGFVLLTAMLALGTYKFTEKYWGPAILDLVR